MTIYGNDLNIYLRSVNIGIIHCCLLNTNVCGILEVEKHLQTQVGCIKSFWCTLVIISTKIIIF